MVTHDQYVANGLEFTPVCKARALFFLFFSFWEHRSAAGDSIEELQQEFKVTQIQHCDRHTPKSEHYECEHGPSLDINLLVVCTVAP